jgi:4-amino-4-deoxyprephenate dehydrogenase
MLKNAIILGGSGEVGSLLTRSLLNCGVAVTTVDRNPSSHSERPYIQADVTKPSRELDEAIHNADCVCICLPEQIALDSASHLVSAMSDGALWLDTLSVKGPIMRRLDPQAKRGEILSINPMFAPPLGWPGHAVAVVEAGQAGAKVAFFKKLMVQWGASVQPVTAEQHDRLTAALQVATHAAALAFGSALHSLNYDVKAALALATPPHRILLALLYRIVSQNPEVYWDIQAYHPHAAQVRQELITSLSNIGAWAECGDVDKFKQLFQELRSVLGPRDDALALLTSALITATNPER